VARQRGYRQCHIGPQSHRFIALTQPQHVLSFHLNLSGVIALFEVQELLTLNEELHAVEPLTSQLTLKRCLFDEIVYE
jgi:hypothetical protein